MSRVFQLLGVGFIINVVLASLGIESWSFLWWIGVVVLSILIVVIESIWKFYNENN